MDLSLAELEQNADIVLDSLENVGRQGHLIINVDLQMDICKSMEYLETWYHAESKHSDAQELIERVQEQNLYFLEAMDISTEVARNGYIISGDMVALCDALGNESFSTRELQDFALEMKKMADQSLRDANRACICFRRVRQGLMQITNDIPAKVAEIHEERQLILDKNERSGQRVNRAKIVRSWATAATAIVGGITFIGFPPAFIVLPIVLPLISLVADFYEGKMTKKIATRDTQARNCEEAIKFLQDAAFQIAKAINRIESFIGYWTEITSLLDVVSTQISQLRGTKALRLRAIAIKSSWKELQISYFAYKKKMEILKNLCVPPSSNELTTTFIAGSIEDTFVESASSSSSNLHTSFSSNNLHTSSSSNNLHTSSSPSPRVRSSGSTPKQSTSDPLLMFLLQQVEQQHATEQGYYPMGQIDWY